MQESSSRPRHLVVPAMAEPRLRLTIGDGFRFGLGFALATVFLTALGWLAGFLLITRGLMSSGSSGSYFPQPARAVSPR